MDDCKNGAFVNTLLTTTSVTDYTITNMTPGSVCRFRMLVTNIIGNSPYSDVLTILFADVPGAPSAPTYVTRSGGNSTIGLTPYIKIAWTAP
jgi:hypothetical protein